MPRYENPAALWRSDDYIWRGEARPARLAAIKRQIASGKLHLLREVALQHPDFVAPYNIEAINGILGAAETEFDFLEHCGIKVPDFRWRVITPGHTRPRVFTKISVVEGVAPPYDHSGAQQIREGVEMYYDTPREGRRLSDLDKFSQYIIGYERHTPPSKPDQSPGVYLVDIEPIFAN